MVGISPLVTKDYFIAFQVNELLAAGYELLQINEDFRDAAILHEWRSALPIDIRLARFIGLQQGIPGREEAPLTSLGTTHFGETYLQQIPRL